MPSPLNTTPGTPPTLPNQQAANNHKYQPVLALLTGKGAQEGYLAAADQGLISAANFLATILLARSVTPTELGMYGVGFTALRLARAVQEGLIIQPMNVFGAGMDRDTFRRYATGSSILQAGLALASAAVVAGGGWMLTALGNDTAGPTLFALWFSFLFWQLQEYVRRMLYTRRQVTHALLNSLVANAVRLALMLWWIGKGRLTGILGLDAIAWGALAALVISLWFTREYWSVESENLRVTVRRNWDFGRWVLGGQLANWLAVEAYPVLTAGLISFAAAGAYRALQNLVAPIHLLLRATDTFLTPRAARLFDQQGRPGLTRTMRMIYIFAGIPILGLLLLAVAFPAPLLRLLYGDTYLPYKDGILLMALFYALWFAYWPLQTAFKAARLSRPIFIANLAAIATMFTLGLWAILQWGVYGTIAGQALNALVVNLILWLAWVQQPAGQPAVPTGLPAVPKGHQESQGQ